MYKKIILPAVIIFFGFGLVLFLYSLTSDKINNWLSSPRDKTSQQANMSQKISVKSDVSNMSISIGDYQGLSDFLDTINFWEINSWQDSQFQNISIKPSTLTIIYTDQPQVFNKENTASNICIGSVGINFQNNNMNILIHSDKSLWKEIDPGWHIQTQLMGYVYGMSNIDDKSNFPKLLNEFNQKPKFFKLNEK